MQRRTEAELAEGEAQNEAAKNSEVLRTPKATGVTKSTQQSGSQDPRKTTG